MHLQSRPVPSLGLLHILEDTLSLLEGEAVEQRRRHYVLQKSRAFLSKATRGRSISQQKRLFVEPANWAALESFTLLNQYLSQPESNVVSLRAVSGVLAKLEDRKRISREERQTAIHTLRELCTSMGRDISPRCCCYFT